MEFEFTITDSIYIPEEDLNEMARLVKNGESTKDVVEDYILGWSDYYDSISDAFDYKIIDEVKRRAKLL